MKLESKEGSITLECEAGLGCFLTWLAATVTAIGLLYVHGLLLERGQSYALIALMFIVVGWLLVSVVLLDRWASLMQHHNEDALLADAEQKRLRTARIRAAWTESKGMKDEWGQTNPLMTREDRRIWSWTELGDVMRLDALHDHRQSRLDAAIRNSKTQRGVLGGSVVAQYKTRIQQVHEGRYQLAPYVIY